MQSLKNIPIVLTGPSGAGKTELINYIVKNYSSFMEASGFTTRPRRNGETEKIQSVTKEEFEKLISRNGLIEYCTYNGNYYGVPKSEFKKLEKYNLIFNVGYSSAKVIKSMYSDTLMIYLLPPDKKELLRRLGNREYERYLLGIEETMKNALKYDYLLISETNNLKNTCDNFMHIVEKNQKQIETKLLMQKNKDFIDDFYR